VEPVKARLSLRKELNYMLFSLEIEESRRLVPCPICKTLDNLKVKQGHGASIVCIRCHIAADWIPGDNFQDEREAAIRQWNSEMSKPEAEGLCNQIIAEHEKLVQST
jgi:hypothetical protein